MNTTKLAVSIFLASFIFCSEAADTQLSPQEVQKLIEPLMSDINSLSSMLFELASSQYKRDTLKKRVCIYTAHRGDVIKTFTDGKYIVVSLPMQKSSVAVCRFAQHYNSFNLREADIDVSAGQYSAAKELISLLKRFDCSDLGKNKYDKRLEIISEIEAGKNVELNKQSYASLFIDYAARMNLEQLDEVNPERVPDLFKLKP